MSTAPPTVPQPTPPAAEEMPREIRIVSHCNLFYWWPVWAVGFLLALISLFSDKRMVMVNSGAKFFPHAEVRAGGTTHEDKATWAFTLTKSELDTYKEEKLRVSGSKNLGVAFSIVLLLVIAITNIPLRGLWSVIVIVVIIGVSIILALLEVWGTILDAIGLLDIRINFEGYLLISTVLFVLWLLIFTLFDRQVYMIFTPRQLRVRMEIGDSETAYDATGMTIQKQRSDLFRHWILGLGSGDLIVRTAGAQSHHFDMPNVLFLGRKVKLIEKMLSSMTVVSQQE